MIQLRDYQQESIEKIREALKTSRKVLFVLPTGGGKTIVTAFMMMRAVKDKGLKAWFLVHREELINQTAKKFDLFDLDYTYICANKKYDPSKPIALCMIQTLVNRIESISPENYPDIVFIDESHHCVSTSYLRVLNCLSDKWQIGLTATPKRLDGRGLGGVFETLVLGPSMKELQAKGALTKYLIVAPENELSLKNVGSVGGDYNLKQLAEEIKRAKIIGDAVTEYRTHADGKKLIAFCPTIDAANELADVYNAAGIPAKAISSKTPEDEREQAILDFAAGVIRILVNVDLVGEGFDVPDCDGIQMFSATKSLVKFIQMCGRAFRPDPNNPSKRAIIIDHVKNWEEHGFPCMDHRWALEYPKKKKSKGMSAKRCPKCKAVIPVVDTKCPECGYVFPQEVAKTKILNVRLRVIDPDGVVKNFNSETEKAAYVKSELRKCKLLTEFRDLAIRAGYKPFWGNTQFEIRQRYKNRKRGSRENTS